MTCKHCGQEIDFNIGSGPGQAAYLHIEVESEMDANHNAEPDESPVMPEMTSDYNDFGH